jgi:SAM-dependent methyltransferase
MKRATGSPEALDRDHGVAPAGYFAKYYGQRNWRFYAPLLASVIQHAPPGPIVDLGAGSGLFVEAADRWGLACIGLDGSREGIDAARARRPGLDLRHHVLSDALPLGDESCGSVVLNQVIEHLGQDLAVEVLREGYRVLKPGGLLLVTSPSRFNRRETRADPTHVRLYAPRELARLISDVGFVELASMDDALPFLGSSRLGRTLTTAALRITHVQRLSATANCRAHKPCAR